jgi:hypothetical protein
LRLGEDLLSGSRGLVVTHDPAAIDVLGRDEESLVFEIVEQGVEGARRDLVTVAAQLLGHPCAAHRGEGGVVQNVESNCSSKKVANYVHIESRHRIP